MEAERLHASRMSLRSSSLSERLQPLARARVGGDDDRQAATCRAPRSRQSSSIRSRSGESTFSSRCALTRKYSPGVEPEPLEDVGGVDLVAEVLEHLAHRRARHEDAARVQALGEQVAARVLGVGEVEVGDVVDEPPVGLLRARSRRSSGCRPPCGRSGCASAWPSRSRCRSWCRRARAPRPAAPRAAPSRSRSARRPGPRPG